VSYKEYDLFLTLLKFHVHEIEKNLKQIPLFVIEPYLTTLYYERYTVEKETSDNSNPIFYLPMIQFREQRTNNGMCKCSLNQDRYFFQEIRRISVIFPSSLPRYLIP
jgi:hypothetical protein